MPQIRRTIGFYAHDGVQLLDVCGPLEVFGEAAKRGAPYDLLVLSPTGQDVVSSVNVRLSVDMAGEDAPPLDTIIIAGSEQLATDDKSRTELASAAYPVATGARRVASVCTGAFVTASLGMLDGRNATTHWRHASRLQSLFPAVAVQPDAIFVKSGNVFTSAGVSAGLDLALALVEEDHGPDLTREIARELVLFMQRPGGQSQFSVRTGISRTPTPVIRTILDQVAHEPAADHHTDALARAAHISERHLRRLFKSELGMTPAQYVEQVRVEHARSLLETGSSVTNAAARSGLGSDETLRRAFAGTYGTTPSEYRQRFASTKRTTER